MPGKLVVGNWKMNGDLRRNDALLADLRVGWPMQATRQIAVCVPFPSVRITSPVPSKLIRQ